MVIMYMQFLLAIMFLYILNELTTCIFDQAHIHVNQHTYCYVLDLSNIM
jgi:hypothetical protein